MDEELFKKGLEKRKATLGKEYVEKNLEKMKKIKILNATENLVPQQLFQ